MSHWRSLRFLLQRISIGGWDLKGVCTSLVGEFDIIVVMSVCRSDNDIRRWTSEVFYGNIDNFWLIFISWLLCKWLMLVIMWTKLKGEIVVEIFYNFVCIIYLGKMRLKRLACALKCKQRDPSITKTFKERFGMVLKIVFSKGPAC